MMVPLVTENQSHLNSRSTGLGNNTASFIRGKGILSSGSDTARLSGIHTGWGNTEQVKSSSNSAAQHVRAMDTQAHTMARTIQRMANDIRTFRKNFPPFPRGSEERERLLKSFQGIRKQIERLTFPPKKVADPTVQGHAATQAGSEIALVEGFETLLQNIAAYLPHIPESASDVALQELEEKLDTLLDFISRERSRLVEQKKYYQEDGDKEIAFMMTSFSISMGQIFSDQSGWQMTLSQTHLKALQA